jgi:hypothetical protein
VALVAFVLGAVVLAWVAVMHGGEEAAPPEAEPDVPAAVGETARQVVQQANEAAQGGRGAPDPERPEPDPDDAPIRLDEAEVQRKATERGIAVVDRNLADLADKAKQAEQAGNTAQARLMRKRMEALRERRALLEAERAEQLAAQEDDADE